MAKVGIAVASMALVLAPEIAAAQVGAPPMPNMPPMTRPMPPMMPPQTGPVPHAPPMVRPMPPMAPPMGPRPGGERWGQVPGGWGAYRQPVYGYTLPRYWVAPTYYISDYGRYGLPAPAYGYGWSRYYDDMVLTDQWGRVYDWRGADDGRDPSYDGERGGDYRSRKRDKSGIVGAIIGGAIGAVTGNLIAGAGSRLAGSLIGGGVGALAGQAIDSGQIGGRDHGYDGRHVGGYGHGYRHQGPHWSMGESAGGYYGGQTVTTTTTTTTYAQPVTTKTVRYVTEYVRVPGKRRTYHAPARTKDRYLGY